MRRAAAFGAMVSLTHEFEVNLQLTSSCGDPIFGSDSDAGDHRESSRLTAAFGGGERSVGSEEFKKKKPTAS